jgi:hypothetical protein
MTVVASKIEQLESLLKNLTEAAYSTLCESNGLTDNEWRTPDGVLNAEWPAESFSDALRDLGAAYSAAKAYFEPTEAERQEKWENACATASYIVQRLAEDAETGDIHPARVCGSLERSIADAIMGTLVQTPLGRETGARPATMADELKALVASGELTEYRPPVTPSE